MAFAVSPPRPPAPSVVTTVTPVAQWPNILRCSLESNGMAGFSSAGSDHEKHEIHEKRRQYNRLLDGVIRQAGVKIFLFRVQPRCRQELCLVEVVQIDVALAKAARAF